MSRGLGDVYKRQFKYGWIDRDTLLESAQRYGKSPYGQHLKNVAEGKLRY